MQRAGKEHDHEVLNRVTKGVKPLEDIEVTAQVMSRIRGLQQPRRTVFRHSGRLAIVFALLLISATVYAASEYIQIRSATGEVKVQHTAQEMNTSDDNLLHQYFLKVQEHAKEGDFVGYYVQDPRVEPSLYFTYKEKRWDSYTAFTAEAKRTEAPILPSKVGSYNYHQGTITPVIPATPAEKSKQEYMQVLSELTLQAKDAPQQSLFFKELPWSEAGAISATYSQGESEVGLHALLLRGGQIEVQQAAEQSAHVISIHDREVIYNAGNRDTVQYHFLSWYNESQDAYYTLTTSGGKVLTKEELLQYAEELIVAGY